MNDNLIETISYKGYEIEVCYDTDAQAPNNWDNDESFLVYDHRDLFIKQKGFDPSDIFEVMQAKQKLYDGYFYFPVYAYIHSGVSLSLARSGWPYNCPWDTSFKGFALIKRQKGTWTREQAYKIAEGLIETWNMYLSGDVYGYNSDVGGCWGFYGKDGMKEMIQEAKAEIDALVRQKQQTHFQQLKTWIKNHVPLSKRQAFAY